MSVELFEKCILTAFTLIEMNRRDSFKDKREASLEYFSVALLLG